MTGAGHGWLSRRPRRWASIALALLLAGCSGESPGPPVTIAGGCQPVASPYLAPSPALAVGRITYCSLGDASVELVESSPLPAGTAVLDLLVAGYPDSEGVVVSAHATDGSAEAVLVHDRVGDHWQALRISMPEGLRDREFVVRVTDNSTAPFGWAGIGFAGAGDVGPHATTFAALLAAPVLAHLWLVLAALSLPAAWRRDIAGPLLVLGAAAMMTLLATMVAPVVGRAMAWVVLLSPIGLVLLRGRSAVPWGDAALLSKRLLPAAALALLVLWIGLYPFHWDGGDWQVPGMRWRGMPIDNWLPLMFAQMLGSGELARPLVGDWLASDRPPLQAGIFLLFRDVLPGNDGLGYQALSTWAQGLVVVAVAPLVARIAGGRDRVALLLAVALSATVLFNALFVWPKLLAAAYCALYHVLVFRRGATRGVLVAAGFAAALALLSHGGAFFALAGSTLALLVHRRFDALRPVALIALVAMVAYAPWAVWQKTVDPPGDRLMKWHFAGVIEPTDRSLREVIVDAYAGTTMDEWMHARRRNFDRVVDGGLRVFPDIGRVLWTPGDRAAKWTVMEKGFFSTVYAMWLFTPLWLPLAWVALRARGRRLVLPEGLASAVALGLAAWILLMFRQDQTVVHQGGHFLVLGLQLLAMAAALQAAGARVVHVIVGVQVALAVTVYGFDRLDAAPWPGTYVAVTLAAVALLAVSCERAMATIGDPEKT